MRKRKDLPSIILPLSGAGAIGHNNYAAFHVFANAPLADNALRAEWAFSEAVRLTRRAE
jgi:hypothetical protein